VAAELGESVAGEEESWHAKAVDIVKKMKEIKRCDIIDFSLGAATGRCWKKPSANSAHRQALEAVICPILTD
jgi:hypothetical protein